MGKAASCAFWSILSLKKLQFSVKVLQVPSLKTQRTFEQHRTVSTEGQPHPRSASCLPRGPCADCTRGPAPLGCRKPEDTHPRLSSVFDVTDLIFTWEQGPCPFMACGFLYVGMILRDRMFRPPWVTPALFILPGVRGFPSHPWRGTQSPQRRVMGGTGRRFIPVQIGKSHILGTP